MYWFFLFSGVVGIVSQSCLAQQSLKLERAALAFYVLMPMMAAHTENKDAIEIPVHVLFMVPAFLVALVFNIEVWIT
jgi:hypothetical protein